jgi:hypothetical protein
MDRARLLDQRVFSDRSVRACRQIAFSGDHIGLKGRQYSQSLIADM